MTEGSQEKILEHLIMFCGFQRIYRKFSDKENLDFDKFTCMKRIGDIHYLFYSEEFKRFTIAVKPEIPKGRPGNSKKWSYEEKYEVKCSGVIYTCH
jgi:hypothetical protein